VVDSLVLEGDLDADGFVGITDLNLVLQFWNDITQDNHPADPSGDNFVGIEDLNIVLRNWNAGTPPASGAPVPEPAGAIIFLAGGGLFLGGHDGRNGDRVECKAVTPEDVVGR
jgi:hypothetical protein